MYIVREETNIMEVKRSFTDFKRLGYEVNGHMKPQTDYRNELYGSSGTVLVPC